MTLIYPDESEHQAARTAPIPFLMFRILSEWGRYDNNLATNLTNCLAWRGTTVMQQFGGYVIPCLIPWTQIVSQIPVDFPHDAVLMIDAESWGGQVTGNRSTEINDLAESLRSRQGGRADLVWGYGNVGDLNTIWPTRPAWMGVIEANYSPNVVQIPNLAGVQYSDGAYNNSPQYGLPYGPVDHNALFVPLPLPGGTLTQPQVDAINAHTDAQVAKVMALLTSVQATSNVRAVAATPEFRNRIIQAANESASQTGAQAAAGVLMNPDSGTHVRVAALQAAVAGLPEPPAVQDVVAAVQATLIPAVVAALPAGVDPAVVVKAVTDVVPVAVGEALGKLQLNVNLAGTAGSGAVTA